MTSHLVSMQSFELMMTITQHYVLDEQIVKRLIGEMVLDLRPDNIEKVFHLPTSSSFCNISYEKARRWYTEHQAEVDKII